MPPLLLTLDIQLVYYILNFF